MKALILWLAKRNPPLAIVTQKYSETITCAGRKKSFNTQTFKEITSVTDAMNIDCVTNKNCGIRLLSNSPGGFCIARHHRTFPLEL
jgi:hypothetical protein